MSRYNNSLFLTVFKKFGGFALAVLVALSCLLLGNATEKSLYANSKVSLAPAVIVDAGHGGFDGGAVASDGTSEKDINLAIALKLQKLLTINGVNVIMTRTSDTATNNGGTKIRSKKVSDMQNRLAVMEENPDAVFVSVHLNKFTASYVSGAQVFYSPCFEESEVLAERIQESIRSVLEPDNNRKIKKATSSAYLLYNAKVPAVIAECGFLSNKEDLAKLKNDDYQTKMAIALSNGVINFLNR